ncbi:MAG: threonylcarbamoyl-AMP synthase [Candidatus Omnitrophica bacterium]|nr:threonylcarbamoyl-AMP synthase [Candidatus Omnitrophota bacterium]
MTATHTLVWRVDPRHPDPELLRRAALLVRSGGLVAFPTETVYGLGVNALDAAAIQRLTEVKQRPSEKRYTLHLYRKEQARDLAAVVPPAAQRLIDACWPGPLTVVLPAVGGGTVGLRLPDHPVARQFLEACGVPVAAPSANRSGEPPPTSAQQVLARLDGAIEAVLDAGPTGGDLPSTVVAISAAGEVRYLRDGALSRQQIQEILKDAHA